MSSRITGELRTRINRQLELQQFQSPLIEDETLPSEHQGMLAGLRERAGSRIAEVTARDERRPNIYFDFVEDSRFNAVAMTIDSDHLIVMTSRALVDIPGVFRRLFALPQFAPHIGDPSKEEEFGVPYVPIDARTMSLIDLLPYPERLPNCPQRRLVATRCSQIAFDFLLLHEVGHLRNGHLPYLFRGKPGQLAEADSVANANDEVVARHTFEMDADSHAVVHSVDDMLSFTGRTWPDEHLKALEKLYATVEGTFYNYFLATYVLFRCFGRRSWTAETIWDGSHPPPEIRQYTLPGVVEAHLARGNQRATKELIPAVKLYQITANVIREVEKGLSQLTGVWVPPRLGTAANTWRTYGKELNEYWIKAYQQLDKLKLGGRLAPPEPWREYGPTAFATWS
jgi:hypothetical protein